MTKPVSIQQRIRILDAQGVSWREIARRLGVSRDTVRKYATMEDCSPKPAVRKGRRSLTDAYSGTVDSWLFADRLMPRKQRHTARRVYARLVEEEDFEGSYSSVQRYVKRWREEHRSDGDGYLELDWSAGVMQVDFGEAVATIGGGDVKVHCLVATFPHSNMRYVAAMPGENAECVCEGLAQIFDHIGMVPRVLVLDNATGAGHRVAWNKVTVVRVFAMFCDHYRLETRFCNPYSGNEKGSVENAVGFLARGGIHIPAQRIQLVFDIGTEFFIGAAVLGRAMAAVGGVIIQLLLCAPEHFLVCLREGAQKHPQALEIAFVPFVGLYLGLGEESFAVAEFVEHTPIVDAFDVVDQRHGFAQQSGKLRLGVVKTLLKGEFPVLLKLRGNIE